MGVREIGSPTCTKCDAYNVSGLLCPECVQKKVDKARREGVNKSKDYLNKLCWTEKDIEYFVRAVFGEEYLTSLEKGDI